MSSKMTHQTLARTLTYVAYHSPAEFGLFWNPDGTMPWKELYWALQEDDSLRFVRESHIRELTCLGFELPFGLDDNGVLRLCEGFPPREYPLAPDVPERLYWGCRRKYFPFVFRNGLVSTGRLFTVLCGTRELAMRIGRRRDPEPVMIEVLARKALAAGTAFRQDGDELYLVESVDHQYLMFPIGYKDAPPKLEGKSARKDKTEAPVPFPSSAGSFILQPDHVQDPYNTGGRDRKVKKEKDRKKTERRKDRHKRSI